MRPLNRPMFRMGGPIKEGIMQGMRNGGLANNEGPRRAALVGNPIYDQTKGPDGRTKHIIPAIIGGGMAAINLGRAGLAAARLAGPAIKKGFQAARAFGATPGKLGFFGRAKDLATIRPGIGLPMASRPESIGFRIGSFAKQNPILALSSPSLATSAITGGGPLAIEAAKGVANFLVPGKRFDPFRDRMPEKKEGETGDLKRVEEIGAGEGTTGGSVVEDPNKAKQIQEDRIAKTKKRYYELMGLDKMKEGAVYDSLIDASKAVQEEGADLKGAIKSGTLQSKIINAISKNLDKSADIKRQIDAAILKGEIQKDVASADTTDKRLKEARIKALDRAEKQAGASGQIAAVVAKDGTITGSQTAAILRADDIKYDGVLQDKLFNNFKKDNPAADEIDFMIAKGKDLDDGRYVIGARLVEKKGNQVAFVV
jgi:hypothetical protein